MTKTARQSEALDPARAHRLHPTAPANPLAFLFVSQLYLALHRDPSLVEAQKNEAEKAAAEAKSSGSDDPELAGLDAAERRRVERARRKAAFRENASKDPAEIRAAEEKEAADKAEEEKKRAEEEKVAKEADAEGAKLLAVSNKLAEAVKYANQLADFCGDRVGSHTLGVEVFIEKHKLLVALRSLRRGLKVDASDPELHVAAVRLLLAAEAPATVAKVSDDVKKVWSLERESLGMADTAAFVASFAKAHGTSMPHRLASAQAHVLLAQGGDMPSESVRLASDLSGEGVTHTRCEEAVAFLRAGGKNAEADALVGQCRERFPLCVAFMTEDKLTARQAVVESHLSAGTESEEAAEKP